MANSLESGSSTAPAELADNFDVVFIGAGVSTSYTLLNMLEDLRAGAPHRPVRVAVIERAEDPYGGQAYGLRSGHTSLLITALKDFLPDEPRGLFSAWLSKNKGWAFDRFRKAGGHLSSAWWSRNCRAIEEDLWDDLYLPRYLFGLYVAETVGDAIADAEAAGVLHYTLIHDEVATVERQGPTYELVARKSGAKFCARYVVLAVGSGPTVERFSGVPEDEPSVLDAACLIEDLYVPSVEGNLARIGDTLSRCADRKINVLIVGGNASTMEALYILNDTPFAQLHGANFFILSPSSSLPERLVDPTPAACFVAENLLELQNQDEPTAEAVYAAALRDLAVGKAAGLSVSDTLAPISRAVVSAVKVLSPAEQLSFAGHWGAELGRYQRRAGNDYADVVASLIAQGRLELVTGKFVEVSRVDASGAAFHYEASDGVTREFDEHMTIILNCSGFRRIEELGEASLLDAMVRARTCQATQWGRGIVVNDDMEANEGLFVMGPLLAGNVIGGFPVWHVEHCGRISAFSATLGATLAKRLAAG